MEYLFVVASFIAIIGISFAFGKLIDNITIKSITQEQIQKAQTKFFISSATIEFIPIILIVIAYAKLEALTGSLINTYVSIALIGLFWLITLTKMFLKGRESSQTVSSDIKQQFNAAVFIAIAFMSGIPIASIVMLLNL